jgi:hypothetical protein
MKRRKLAGIVMIVASAALLMLPVLVILTPIIARIFLHGFYHATADTWALQVLAVISMLGGGGLVGGIWVFRSATKSN